jgi:endonuclease/exonuclease/phosphatase family metal-dependent hydrolase
MRIGMIWSAAIGASLAFATAACTEQAGTSGSGGAGGTDPIISQGSTGGGGEGGQAQGTKPLTIMNWNTRNFLNDVNDPGPEDDDFIKSSSEYQAQINAVAAIIQAQSPDVVMFAEVENLGVLDKLNEKLGGAYSERHLFDSNDPRGIDVAVMSKLPLSNVVSHKDDTFAVEGTQAPEYQFARDCLQVEFTFEQQEFALFGVHLRSKGPPDDPNKRLAEAQRCRAIADEYASGKPDAAIAILGDYNDLPASPPVKAVLGSNPTFFSVTDYVPENDRWTFDYQGVRELIDHQIVNPKMHGLLDTTKVVIPHGSEVGMASDHTPIVATYLLP